MCKFLGFFMQATLAYIKKIGPVRMRFKSNLYTDAKLLTVKQENGKNTLRLVVRKILYH